MNECGCINLGLLGDWWMRVYKLRRWRYEGLYSKEMNELCWNKLDASWERKYYGLKIKKVNLMLQVMTF